MSSRRFVPCVLFAWDLEKVDSMLWYPIAEVKRGKVTCSTCYAATFWNLKRWKQHVDTDNDTSVGVHSLTARRKSSALPHGVHMARAFSWVFKLVAKSANNSLCLVLQPSGEHNKKDDTSFAFWNELIHLQHR